MIQVTKHPGGCVCISDRITERASLFELFNSVQPSSRFAGIYSIKFTIECFFFCDKIKGFSLAQFLSKAAC